MQAVIRELDDGLFKLTITYTYYNIYNFDEHFTFKTLEKCKCKLLDIRTRGYLHIILKK